MNDTKEELITVTLWKSDARTLVNAWENSGFCVELGLKIMSMSSAGDRACDRIVTELREAIGKQQ